MANEITKTALDVIYLVSCAVNEVQPDIERCRKMDARAVFEFSRTHLLTAAVSFALERLGELPHAFDQAQKKAIRKQALFDVERMKILAELEREKIWYLPLKGILLKEYFPKPSMREMSDNDILCDPGRMDDVRGIMENLGYAPEPSENIKHDSYSKLPTLEFEMHRALFTREESPVLAEYYSDISDRLTYSGGYSRKMMDEDFYIYIICHFFNHYSSFGTGLRSLLDIYVFNRRFKASLDREYISRELLKLRLADFEKCMRTLAEKVFLQQPLGDAEKKELFFLAESGAYGTLETGEHNRLSKELGDGSAGSKRRYFLRRMFPTGDALKNNHPIVYKHKALYPLWLLYRPIKGAVKYPKAIIKEVKDVKNFKDNSGG